MRLLINTFLLINLHYSLFTKQEVNGNNDVEPCPPGSYTERYRGSCRSVPIFNDSCTVPNLPPNTMYNQSEIIIEPGIKIPPLTLLKIHCPKNYKLVGHPLTVCFNKTWLLNFGQCLKLCPSIQSTTELNATCFYENRKLDNCSEPFEGTIVKYQCHYHSYSRREANEHAIQVCRNGSWSHSTPKCITSLQTQSCGWTFVDTQLLIVGGVAVRKHEYPWLAAIYLEKESLHICMGVLITESVILTAASCFRRTPIPKNAYKVAVGKYYNEFDDVRDQGDVQFSKLDEIFLPPEYNSLNGSGDIAVLLTTEPFNLSRKVFPICVDWNGDYNNLHASGHIVGWSNILNNQLQKYIIPTRDWQTCNSIYSKNLTRDKFCAGDIDEHDALDIKSGFLGSGLQVNNMGRYYVTGILNHCPRKLASSFCDDNHIFFTNVSSYLSFILNKVSTSRNISGTATKNYPTSLSTPFISLRRCPPVATTASTKVSCISTDNTITDCNFPTDGTVALFKCAPLYESPQNEPFTICKNRAWNQKPPVCFPACGVVPIQAQTLIVGGNGTEKGSFPWQAAVYRSEKGNRKKFICGATMIHQKVFLTAAHCVTHLRNFTLQDKDIFTVAVGKHYREYNDSRDSHAQFSAIKEMFLPTEYQGYLQNYYGDIAILISEKEFELSTYVRPVCVDWDGKFELKSFHNGTVTGWGLMEEVGNLAEELQVLQVPYVSKEQCKEGLDSDYLSYLTFDKMCSGYLNRSKSACQGDSGGGLVFRNHVDGKYYIMGIVSLAPQATSGGCNSQEYTLYTEVSFYVNNFIMTKVPKYGLK